MSNLNQTIEEFIKEYFIEESLPISLLNMNLRNENDSLKQNVIDDKYLNGQIIVSHNYYKRLSLYKID